MVSSYMLSISIILHVLFDSTLSMKFAQPKQRIS